MTTLVPLSVLLCAVLGLAVAGSAVVRIFLLERRAARQAPSLHVRVTRRPEPHSRAA